MSGHYATLLRGTVEAFLPNHDVYITDWSDARMVPIDDGPFDLDDYIDYVISMFHFLGIGAHVVAVCQPSVPVLAAVARMEAENDPYVPFSMTLMGGPIDTRKNPTGVNKLAEERGMNWFRTHVISKVPFPHPGFMREVYPGFLQLSGFVGMNFDKHVDAHREYFKNLVQGDGDPAKKHEEFYDEYLAVMDLSAEFYLQTVEKVFVRHDLAERHLQASRQTGRSVADPPHCTRSPSKARTTIFPASARPQATHDLCPNIPAAKKVHYLQPKVGHYGVFNGSRFRAEIAPRIADFVLSNNTGYADGSSVSSSAKKKPALA